MIGWGRVGCLNEHGWVGECVIGWVGRVGLVV